MKLEAIADDIAKLEPYFAELKSWPSSYTLTADMWPTFSQRVKDALVTDLAEVGYKHTDVYAVEYGDGELVRVTIPVRREVTALGDDYRKWLPPGATKR